MKLFVDIFYTLKHENAYYKFGVFQNSERWLTDQKKTWLLGTLGCRPNCTTRKYEYIKESIVNIQG